MYIILYLSNIKQIFISILNTAFQKHNLNTEIILNTRNVNSRLMYISTFEKGHERRNLHPYKYTQTFYYDINLGSLKVIQG